MTAARGNRCARTQTAPETASTEKLLNQQVCSLKTFSDMSAIGFQFLILTKTVFHQHHPVEQVDQKVEGDVRQQLLKISTQWFLLQGSFLPLLYR